MIHEFHYILLQTCSHWCSAVLFLPRLCFLLVVVGPLFGSVVVKGGVGLCPPVLMSLGGYPEVPLSLQPQACTGIIDSAGTGLKKHSNSPVNCIWISFLKQKSLTDLTMDLWLARWHVDKVSGPTTGNEIAESVTNLLFVLQLLHSDVSRGQISNKGTAAGAIAEPTTQQKRLGRK